MKKAVIVTGASSGIGAATAKLFSSHGYFVYLLGRNEDRLHEVALQCRSGASLLKCDLGNSALIDKAIKNVISRPDTDLQVLVNNAGIYEPGEFAKASLDSWRRQFEVNLFGAIQFTQGILPLFEKKSQGSIVNVASTLGLKPAPNVAAYSASKAAMISWTQTMALELGPKGIRVNCVAPGIVDTPIHSFHALKDSEKSQALQRMSGLQPLGRIGSSEEIAESIYFLGSPLSSWTTGAVLSVDGGINLT